MVAPGLLQPTPVLVMKWTTSPAASTADRHHPGSARHDAIAIIVLVGSADLPQVATPQAAGRIAQDWSLPPTRTPNGEPPSREFGVGVHAEVVPNPRHVVTRPRPTSGAGCRACDETDMNRRSGADHDERDAGDPWEHRPSHGRARGARAARSSVAGDIPPLLDQRLPRLA